ncbi:MAG TPA: Arc family DNA-binding protein [Micromonosporaceae bacterium]|nr:Arc family DNA-binding protein [Micromonosporaceae bacterium]
MAITFDLPPELHEAVRRIAVSERRSITQTLIVAVDEYVQRHGRLHRVDELSKRIAEEDADLLRRLA